MAAEYAASHYISLTRGMKTCSMMLTLDPEQGRLVLTELSTLLMTNLEDVSARLTANNNELIALNDRRLASLLVNIFFSFSSGLLSSF